MPREASTRDAGSDDDPCAATLLAGDVEGAAVQFGQPPRQRQPEAGALAAAGEAAIDLAERLARDRDLGRRHPETGIAHLEFDAAVGAAAHGEDDGAAGIGEFDRIAEQVQQDLLEPGRVGDQRRHLVFDFDRQAQPSGRRPLCDKGQAGLGQRRASIPASSSRSNFPASIFARSRISLMMSSRCAPLWRT